MLKPQILKNLPNVESFLRHCQRKDFKAKSTVLKQGEAGNSLLLILDGSVSVMVEDESEPGHMLVIAYLNPGDFVGEMGLFDAEAPVRSAMVVAKTQCEVAEISYERFHQIRNQFPDILYAVSRQLGIRLRQTTRKLERIVDERTVQLQHLARYDGLTDRANHRTFYETYQKEWAVAGRDKKPLSLITVDIDFFKPYNDTFGHQEGDECLRKVAMAIRSQVKRPADLAARTGGEEFFVLLPGTEKDGALAMAESIRSAIADLAIPHPSSPISSVVTVSLGVATMIPPPITEASHFIARADQALYNAKREGRNRISGDR